MKKPAFSLNLAAVCFLVACPISFTWADSLGTALHLKGDGKVFIEQVYRRNEIVTIKGRAVCDVGRCQEYTDLSGSFLLDEERGVKYYPIRDDGNRLLASTNQSGFNGERFWIKYTAPAEDIKTIDLYLEEMDPIEALPITDK